MRSVSIALLSARTDDILSLVVAGETFVITADGEARARLAPLPRRPYLTKAELMSILALDGADPELAEDHGSLTAENTDDLDWLR